MFSQLRQAVEGFTPPLRVDSPSNDSSSSTVPRPHTIDGNNCSSTGQLAETARANLRKSLANQRSSNLSAGSNTRSPLAPVSRSKLNLEDRLRAIAAAESPARDTQTPASERPPSDPQQPSLVVSRSSTALSPLSIPLPDSPAVSFAVGHVTAASESDPDEAPITLPPPYDGVTPLNPTKVFYSSCNPAISDAPSNERKPVIADTQTNQQSASEVGCIDTSTDPVLSNASKSYEVPKRLDTKSSRSSDDYGLPNATDIESLQERLKEAEKQFTEVSHALKSLQSEKLAISGVLRDITGTESDDDISKLRLFFDEINKDATNNKKELRNIRARLQASEEQIVHLQVTHRKELDTQSQELTQFKSQLSEAKALLAASQEIIDQADDQSDEYKKELHNLKTGIEALRVQVGEEEEKRTKAISLLKTVRQKLVKTEKEKEDALKEIAALQEKDRSEQEKEGAERERLKREVELIGSQCDQTVATLKTRHERELSALRERFETEIASLQNQFENKVSALKSSQSKELGNKDNQITSLEASLNAVVQDKDNLFDHLQLRQAESESAQSHLESLQSQNTELEYQLRELRDQMALLTEDLTEARRQAGSPAANPPILVSDVAQMLSNTEARYEAKYAAMNRNLQVLEKERNDVETEWSRKLQEKARELEETNGLITRTAKMREHHEEIVFNLQAQIFGLRDSVVELQNTVEASEKENRRLQEVEQVTSASEEDLRGQVKALEQQVEELKAREVQLRTNNKNLRDELRKVQSSAALLDRQRTPGTTYRSNRHAESSPDVSISTTATSPQENLLNTSSSNNQEEVNLEYLRNVILQFLEHKEMRPHLVRVLSTILQFTPQETRRLISRVQ